MSIKDIGIGKKMTNIVEVKLSELTGLCVKHRVRNLSLFGSSIREDFDDDASDLDFMVEFVELTPREHANAYFGLMEELEQVFGRPIDLVERRAIQNPYFLKAADQNRVEVYAAA